MSLFSRVIPRSLSPFARASWLVAAIVGTSCATLPTIAANQCGNGVVEPGEDCDGFAAKGSKCRPKDDAFACRFDCNDAPCPTGYLCGKTDGICQAPSGSFSPNAAKIDVPAARVNLGDFNGDGTHDVLTRTRPDEAARESLRILYLAPGAETTSRIFPIHTLAISPQIANATTPDKFDDLFFGSAGEGLDVLLGAQDGTLSPLAFARFPLAANSIVSMTLVHGLPFAATPFREAPLVLFEALGQNVITVASNSTDPLDSVIGILPQPVSNLLGPPRSANIVESTDCDEMLLVFKGDSSLSMYSPCLPTGELRTKKTAELAPRKLLSFPGKTIDQPPVTTDLNGDGHQDVLLRAGNQTFVGFGRGDGTFSSTSDLLSPTELAVATCIGISPTDGTPSPPQDCAALDVEPAKSPALGQHVVTTNALIRIDKLVSTSTTLNIIGTVLAQQSGGGWTVAKIADLNRDGIVDVAAASSTALDIDFFNGTPGADGFFNPSKVRTDAPVSQLGVGDYDGDLVNDLAIIEVGVDGPDVDGIDVAYGNFAGPPEAPFRMGEFPHIRQIASGRFAGLDSVDELGLIYAPADGDQVTVLDGQGDRQLLSPFGLGGIVSDSGNIQGSPIALALGQFDSDPLPDSVTFAFDATKDPKVGIDHPRFWLAPIRDQARLVSAQPSDVVPGIQIVIGAESAGDPTFALSGLVRAGDLDGDGIDEAIAIAPSRGKASGTLIIAKVSGDAAKPFFKVSNSFELPPSWVPTGDSDLVAQDIDGDGHKDLVVLCQGRRGRAAFFVLWNDGKGGFDLGQRTTIAPTDPEEHVLGMTPIVGGQGLVAPLVAITEKATYLVKPASASALRDLSLFAIPGVSGGLSIAAGDVSADGVPDLIIATGSSVVIHRGIARQP